MQRELLKNPDCQERLLTKGKSPDAGKTDDGWKDR